MRLSKIKLAGFKSFVDPTSVSFPGNLTGVVGPNGCGKSNIIDAVRWVMGEISAKHLRGDSMADVIFNGSGGRKPIGAASVELVFDNADGAIAGPYASFAEVSLKRVVSRDGTSTYYINGSKCRRKDITHLFLGTGLGSRSYAIIEQGMISRLIEARPEDMRSFVEEAAGISRYKDRRRETENRISHTRENLERLNDLREEVDKQIRHLQRQAGVARRYQDLKEQQRRLQAELLALRIRDLDADVAGKSSMVTERETKLQATIADLRSAESSIERARALQNERSDALGEVQGRYYQAGAEATRTEQSLQHSRELRQRQRADLERLAQGLGESQALLGRDEQQLLELQATLAQVQPEFETARAAETAARDILNSAEASAADWQQRWEQFSRGCGESSQKTLVERARIEQLETRLVRLVAQRERIEQERKHLQELAAGARVEDLESAEQAAREQGAREQSALEQVLEELKSSRDKATRLNAELDASRAALQQSRGALVSSEALQKAALGQAQGKVVEWLASRRLDSLPRLAQQLEVSRGWERAVETALGGYLEAVCSDSLDAVAEFVDSLDAGQVTFAELSGPAPAAAAGSLRERVQGPAVISGLLDGILAVDTLGEAIARRRSLAAGQSIMTRDGVWIGRDWLRVSRDEDAHAGVIVREGDIRRLRAEAADGDARVGQLEQSATSVKESIFELESQREERQAAVNRLHRDYVSARGALEAMRSRVEQTAERLQRLTAEAGDASEEITRVELETREARQRLQAGLTDMQALEDQRPAIEAERDQVRAAVNAARQQTAADQHAAQQVAIRMESLRSTQASLQTALERARDQVGQFGRRRSELELQLESGATPLRDLEAELQALLTQRLAVEQELATARKLLAEAESESQALDGRRQQVESQVESARAALAEVQLGVQEARIRRESLMEQFTVTKYELTDLQAALAAEASVVAWDESLTEVSARIERLGAVNLASIDELKEQSERKDYLDRQYADLTDALNTLEQAIKRIDRETRARFQDTFDRINAGLKEKFPRLFAGGSAYLELVGDDVLTAGVAVMARPPGKRNSNISQLSGGEKALTAVALVFSIFELNPAPFCLLDEVDAPLDDHNVGRFCDIVRDMAQRVQFIFITHNKATMEMAGQLIGVTMHEPGVSRLVAVDVDEAVRMAGAG